MTKCSENSLLELLQELEIPYEEVKQAPEEGGYIERETDL